MFVSSHPNIINPHGMYPVLRISHLHAVCSA